MNIPLAPSPRAFVAVALLLALLVACSSSALTATSMPPPPDLQLGPQPAPNFAFSLESHWTGGRDYTLSTFVDIYQSHVPYEPERLSVKLTDGQIMKVYNKIVEISFFSYPSEFEYVPGETVAPATVTSETIIHKETIVEKSSYPSTYYVITARNGNYIHNVRFINVSTMPGTPQTERLRSLIDLIDELVAEHPDIQQFHRSRQ